MSERTPTANSEAAGAERKDGLKASDPSAGVSLPGLAGRGVIGGLLMGFANLVPGISGGAMLLIVGMYHTFVGAIAEFATLKFRLRSIVGFGAVAGAAGTSILLLAGPIKSLIINYRWETFSVFIGMRLAAIPIVWRLARPATPSLWIGACAGFIATAIAATFMYAGPSGDSALAPSDVNFFLAGLAGASATLLPGLDGSYLMMLLGQYVPILAAIDRFKDALGTGEVATIWSAFRTLMPVGFGVAMGIGGVSLLIRHLLTKFPKPTYGVLLGILAGAFVGLWPFAEYVQPKIGDTLKSGVVTAENLSSIKVEDWPLQFLIPTTTQAVGALAFVLAGIALAWLISKLEPAKPE